MMQGNPVDTDKEPSLASSAMEIYVEDEVLKCAPFGRGRGKILTYTGVNPLTVDEWQHISCTYI